jgi:hypothetical protein
MHFAKKRVLMKFPKHFLKLKRPDDRMEVAGARSSLLLSTAPLRTASTTQSLKLSNVIPA